MPLLRASELGDIIDKAQPARRAVRRRLLDELRAARSEAHRCCRPWCPSITPDAAGSLRRVRRAEAGDFTACPTAADDIALMAFTSGTTGKPKAPCTPPRRAGRLRSLAAPRAAGHARRIVRRHAAAGLHLRPGRPADVPDVRPAPRVFPDAPVHARVAGARRSARSARPSATPRRPSTARWRRSRSSTACRSLRMSVSAGEGLPDATRQLWKEATGIEMMDGIGAHRDVPHLHLARRRPRCGAAPSARWCPATPRKVVDDEGNEVPRGTIGKLAVIGPTGCRYLDDARQANYVKDGWNYPATPSCRTRTATSSTRRAPTT